jgi:hypothetical protein
MILSQLQILGSLSLLFVYWYFKSMGTAGGCKDVSLDRITDYFEY